MPVLLSLAASAQAGTSAPFDVNNFLLGLIVYVAGLIVLFVAAAKGSSAAGMVALVWFIGPPVWVVYEWQRFGREGAEQNARVEAAFQKDKTTAERAFALACKDRQLKVAAKVRFRAQDDDEQRSLMVRIERGFPVDAASFNAGPVADFLERKKVACGRTGIRYVVGIYGTPSDFKRIKSYPACMRFAEAASRETEFGRYELILGEKAATTNVDGIQGAAWLVRRSSVRLADRKTGKTLAEDTLYFLNFDSGQGGCPVAEQQIADLIGSVFESE